MAVYVHPVAPLIATKWSDFPYLFAVTLEREWTQARSVALQFEYGTKDRGSVDPYGQVDWTGAHDDYIYYRMWSLRGSVRLFRNKQECTGLYLAPSLEYMDMDSRTSKSLKQVKTIAGLVYAGYRGKWSWFTAYADVGAGYIIASSGTMQTTGSDASPSSFDIGGNIGVGVPF
jgi:hypothetical protein